MDDNAHQTIVNSSEFLVVFVENGFAVLHLFAVHVLEPVEMYD
jgi:hypothetical protein